MASDEKTTQISAGTPGDMAGAAAPGRANPAALALEQVARMLGVAEEKVRDHLAAGAPRAADGTVNLVQYVAWLNRELASVDGD